MHPSLGDRAQRAGGPEPEAQAGSWLVERALKAGSPPFRAQHLSGLQLVSDLCSGRLQGGSIGSSEISLRPGTIRAGKHTADTQTAG